MLDRRQFAWANQRHITEEALEQASRRIINAYYQFALPRYWGSGKHAAADGTKWDVYERNLACGRDQELLRRVGNNCGQVAAGNGRVPDCCQARRPAAAADLKFLVDITN